MPISLKQWCCAPGRRENHGSDSRRPLRFCPRPPGWPLTAGSGLPPADFPKLPPADFPETVALRVRTSRAPRCLSSCLELCRRMIEIPSERKRRAPLPGGPDSSMRRSLSRTLRQLRCILDNAKQPALCPRSSVLPSCGVVGSVLPPRLLCEPDTAEPAALPRASKGHTACTATWPRCLRRELVEINSQLPSSGEYITPKLQSHPFARGDR